MPLDDLESKLGTHFTKVRHFFFFFHGFNTCLVMQQQYQSGKSHCGPWGPGFVHVWLPRGRGTHFAQ